MQRKLSKENLNPIIQAKKNHCEQDLHHMLDEARGRCGLVYIPSEPTEKELFDNKLYFYPSENPEQLAMPPSKDETPFSTPRSWHMLSDAACHAETRNEVLDVLIGLPYITWDREHQDIGRANAMARAA